MPCDFGHRRRVYRVFQQCFKWIVSLFLANERLGLFSLFSSLQRNFSIYVERRKRTWRQLVSVRRYVAFEESASPRKSFVARDFSSSFFFFFFFLFLYRGTRATDSLFNVYRGKRTRRRSASGDLTSVFLFSPTRDTSRGLPFVVRFHSRMDTPRQWKVLVASISRRTNAAVFSMYQRGDAAPGRHCRHNEVVLARDNTRGSPSTYYTV